MASTVAVTLLKRHPIKDSIRGKMIRCLMTRSKNSSGILATATAVSPDERATLPGNKTRAGRLCQGL